MKLSFRPPAAAVTCWLLATLASSQELDLLKQTTDRWIEARNRLSKEQTDWAVEKDLLKATQSTLASTRDTVSENLYRLQLESKKLDEQLLDAQTKLQDLEATRQVIEDATQRQEHQIRTIVAWLPSPLRDKIKPLARKIPAPGSKDVPTPNRLQNIVAISSMIDEFNNTLTLSHTMRTLENGEAIDVRVLYWGLATAYATDRSGARAWILSPAPDAWTWTPAPEHAPAIKQLFDVYDKTIDPLAVEVPFTFVKKEEAP
ncbi:DUF3450 family protein [Pelagicoccus sp. SDUM812003]|uniref:DUF3450 family protein n=1 Tax=Pelagicoccus sp. SDUM812003 TaxID=3041267 RepID=UPI00280E71E8|nr:DUF3450 family protein [Pelagicoccus sp. SDUM812003]MDQ8202304.1 DUF3450 family protein [Pelagicoccus sp. SDUM812003]